MSIEPNDIAAVAELALRVAEPLAAVVASLEHG